MKRTLALSLLPAAALLAVAAVPAGAPGRSPLLVPVDPGQEKKLRNERLWVKIQAAGGLTTEAILLSYRSKTGEFTIAPDENDPLKHVQVPEGTVRIVQLVKAYVAKPTDPLADAFKDLSRQVREKWEKTLLDVLRAREAGELDAYTKNLEDKIRKLRVPPGPMREKMRNSRRVHEVLRAEIPKLLFAYAAGGPEGDGMWLQKAVKRLGKLTEKIGDRHVRQMYRRRVEGIRRSIENGGGPDAGRRPDRRPDRRRGPGGGPR